MNSRQEATSAGADGAAAAPGSASATELTRVVRRGTRRVNPQPLTPQERAAQTGLILRAAADQIRQYVSPVAYVRAYYPELLIDWSKYTTPIGPFTGVAS